MKKALVLLLALVMLVSTFVACKPGQGGPESTPAPGGESSNNNPSSSGPAESEEESKFDGLDMGANEVTIISRGHYYFADEVAVEESGGDPIDNAIFQRNLDVERILNCTLDNFKVTESGLGGGTDADYAVIATLKNTIGPDCPYDIMSASAYTAFENTAAGLCLNLTDVDYLDLDQNYWAPYYNEGATIGNQQYFATGAISLSLRRFIFVTFFNTRLVEERGIEDLYSVVNEKRWTLEYQAGIINGVYENLDGDDTHSAGDFYGFVTNHHICVDPYWAACDVTILEKDEDDYFVFNPQLEKLDAILSKLKEIYYTSGGTYSYTGKSGDTDQNDIRMAFTNATAMMTTLRLLEVEADDFRNMEDSYGILPMPKFDDDQQEYYSHAHDQFAVYGIVSSVPATEVDNLGAVLECMAIEGYRTVTPAYYEIALKGKYSKDPQSWEMLDMIVSNLKIDGGLLYTIILTDITQQLRNVVKNNSPTISSIVFNTVRLKGLERALTAMNESIKALQES